MARFARDVEFVNALVALVVVVAGWVLVVELLAHSARNDHAGNDARYDRARRP